MTKAVFALETQGMAKKKHFWFIFFCSAIPCFSKAKTAFFHTSVLLPYRIVTNPYTPNIELCQLFFKTFILYGFCLYFNFSSMPSL